MKKSVVDLYLNKEVLLYIKYLKNETEDEETGEKTTVQGTLQCYIIDEDDLYYHTGENQIEVQRSIKKEDVAIIELYDPSMIEESFGEVPDGETIN